MSINYTKFWKTRRRNETLSHESKNVLQKSLFLAGFWIHVCFRQSKVCVNILMHGKVSGSCFLIKGD
ncbi:conserved hypothetical protein [Listeria monocytogenes]|nr:conserved hypothetical protein [Listeria monocytogenes]